MTRWMDPLLINILGHAGGALIFAIFLSLLFSAHGWSGSRGRTLSACAALLSLVWNLGSLVVLMPWGLSPQMLAIAAAVSFSVLSVLPAVLLDVSLEGARRHLVWAGYALSAAAVAMHFSELGGNGERRHQTALLLITAGFLVLTALAAAGPWRGRGARIAAAMCLALFAMSFLHFGAGHAGQAWSSELVIHHAGIPLALFVLLQDYRFVLLDAFVRFLANALLAALLTSLLIALAFRFALLGPVSPPAEAAILVSVCLFLVCFAWLRGAVQAWLTHAVFRHGNLASLPDLVKGGASSMAEAEYVEWAAARLAESLHAERHAVAAESASEPWAEAAVPVRLGPGDLRTLLLGRRRGGQRYLGEDLDALGKAALAIGERVDALRQEEMRRLVNQAELRALQSQINPHFLFNALNTLYGTIPRESAAARRMVLNLAEIFRYSLQSERAFVPLSRELEIVRAYLAVEQARLGDRLVVDLAVEDSALAVPIPVLSVQPLVENAIKHGVALRTEPGEVRLHAACVDGALRIVVENSASEVTTGSGGAGVGLANVRRRLEICYGTAASVDLAFHGATTAAELRIPLSATAPYTG